MDAPSRAYFEPQVGGNLSGVRIHDDADAARSASAVGAHAYAVANHIVFAQGRFEPATSAGQGLLAHELAHVAHEARAGPRGRQPSSVLWRLVDCSPARLSLQECPPRETGEVARAARSPMAVLNVSGTEHGFLVANFAVGSSKIKPSLARTIYWNEFVSQIGQQPNQHWEILGLTDCEGTASRNTELRRQRAQAIYALLPPDAKKTITSVEAAPTGECMTGNDSAADRTLNRSVLFRLVGGYTHVDIQPEVITGQGPRPQPEPDLDIWPKWEKRGLLSRLWSGIETAADGAYRGGKWAVKGVYRGGKWLAEGVYEGGKVVVNVGIDAVKHAAHGAKLVVTFTVDIAKSAAKDVYRAGRIVLGTSVDVAQETAKHLYDAGARIGHAAGHAGRVSLKMAGGILGTGIVILGPTELAQLGLELLAAEFAEAPATRLVPGGGLTAHEALGGHTLDRHVGVTDADLIARLAAQPNITGASSFTSRAVAETAIADALDANAADIRAWLGGAGARHVVTWQAAEPVGRWVTQGSHAVLNVSGVQAVLVRANTAIGYRILTAFPVP